MFLVIGFQRLLYTFPCLALEEFAWDFSLALAERLQT